MRIPYGYILEDGQFVLDESKVFVVRMIFAYYLAGASLGKVADLLFEKGVLSPTGNERWTRAAIDKLLSNAKYIPIVGFESYTDVQFDKERRCYFDYDRAGNPRKTIRYQSPDMTM